MSQREIITLTDVTTTTDASNVNATGAQYTLPNGCMVLCVVKTIVRYDASSYSAAGLFYQTYSVSSGGSITVMGSTSSIGTWTAAGAGGGFINLLSRTGLTPDLTTCQLTTTNSSGTVIVPQLTGVAATTLEWFTVATYYIN
jgi:hypothetical protein